MSNSYNYMDIGSICPNCFGDTGGAQPCPFCGWQKGQFDQDGWNRLTPGTLLNGRYMVGRVLGQGGFGITYLGLDLSLGAKLAIKEYFPAGLAARNMANKTVMTASRDCGEDFRDGMRKFLDEARTLARFDDNTCIVSVKDFFESNGTAYMVMSYLEGRTLLKYIQSCGGKISFDEAIRILAPVMDALNYIHASGLIHRDISPDNIFITDAGAPCLLDFGAAKSALALARHETHSVVLKKGYSPPEQYQSHGALGPWSDVYSMAATIYRCVTGVLPPDTNDRLGGDELLPPSRQGAMLPSAAEAALMKALSIAPQQRFQNMFDFRNALTGAGFQTVGPAAGVTPSYVKTQPARISASTNYSRPHKETSGTNWAVIFGAITLSAVMFLALGIFVYNRYIVPPASPVSVQQSAPTRPVAAPVPRSVQQPSTAEAPETPQQPEDNGARASQEAAIDLPYQEEHEIDTWCGHALSADNLSTADMREITGEANDRWDAELNVQYANLMSMLAPAGQDKLKAAERAWLKFRSAETEAFYPISDIYEGGGSIQGVECQRVYYDLSRTRFFDLLYYSRGSGTDDGGAPQWAARLETEYAALKSMLADYPKARQALKNAELAWIDFSNREEELASFMNRPNRKSELLRFRLKQIEEYKENIASFIED